MGNKADDILRSFQMSEEDKQKYAKVKEKFNDKRKTIFFESEIKQVT